jgi:hypothetical protein
MKDEKGKRFQNSVNDARSEEEFEKKFFPITHEKKKREKAMRDPKIFEERLKEKLLKCLIKK